MGDHLLQLLASRHGRHSRHTGEHPTDDGRSHPSHPSCPDPDETSVELRPYVRILLRMVGAVPRPPGPKECMTLPGTPRPGERVWKVRDRGNQRRAERVPLLQGLRVVIVGASCA